MEPSDIEKLVGSLKPLLEGGTDFWLLVVVVILVFLSLLSKILDGLMGMFQGIGSLVSRMVSIFGRRERGEWMTRKKQFLKVVISDLSSIAKAEAWNDQHFTDLEAEVEIEGSYYSSRWMRFRKKRSSGLRREPSLIKAIDESSERCLLLMGDPGSGKSVALRHLAMQMAERSLKSSKELAPIPLYVNLREMGSLAADEITVDAVKRFVIDNMRRGDADTAEYIKSNWDDFQKRGIWFFLFDSFDEIPAVLHSAVVEKAVASYGKAIQQFMDGFGGCRGVLASREYKSPGAIPWPRLKILPLNEDRQEELVGRTFLSKEQKNIALRAVSLSPSATFRNPLFLTLLCRYVRENSAPPANEHELLYVHVKSLANRDGDYVAQRWGLGANNLLDGASKLAMLYAVTPDLGLAPTVDEIEGALNGESLVQGASVSSVIEALTYVKIGRTDVPSSDKSHRRFAFSHRRYQECLFAMLLSRQEDTLAPENLIGDARWREYTVALLQVAPIDVIRKLVGVARKMLEAKASKFPLKSRKYYGEEIRYGTWDDPELEHILAVFLEAKRYAPEGPWEMLVEPVEKILSSVWSKGDMYDKWKVMRFCGLGRPASMNKRIHFAIGSGVARIEESAIDACRFLTSPGENIAAWVRNQLATRMTSARTRFEFLRWEAISSQLPSVYQMSICIDRAKTLSLFSPVVKFTSYILNSMLWISSSLLSIMDVGGPARRVRSAVNSVSVGAIYGATFSIVAIASTSRDGVEGMEWVGILLAVLILMFSLKFFIRMAFIGEPHRLGLNFLFLQSRRIARASGIVALAMAATLLAFGLPGMIVIGISYLFGFHPEKPYEFFLGVTMVCIFSAALAFILKSLIANRRSRRFVNGMTSAGLSLERAIISARNAEDLAIVSSGAGRFHPTKEELRFCISMLSAANNLIARDKADGYWFSELTKSDMRRALSRLLSRMDDGVDGSGGRVQKNATY